MMRRKEPREDLMTDALPLIAVDDDKSVRRYLT